MDNTRHRPHRAHRAHRSPAPALIGLLLAVTVVGCSASDPYSPEGAQDPEEYVEQYDPASGDDTAVSGGIAEGATEAAPPTPPITGDNTFVGTDESVFASTEGDPLSTFGLDVDTGSWTSAA